MNLKEYIIKKVMMSFFISTACIGVAMGVLGIAFEPTRQFGYEAYLFPPLYGLLGTLPQFVLYAKRELSIKELFIRKICHMLLLEGIILGFLYSNGALKEVALTLAVALSIFIIAVTVYLVQWVNDSRTARLFNEELKKMQYQYQKAQCDK